VIAGLQRAAQELVLRARKLHGPQVARQLRSDSLLGLRAEAERAHLLALVDLLDDDLVDDGLRVEEGAGRDDAALDLAGVAASSGSACASGSLDPSHVLLAMGLSLEEALGSLRLTVGYATEAAEVDRAIAALRALPAPVSARG
jgi:cysteine desulfurase